MKLPPEALDFSRNWKSKRDALGDHVGKYLYSSQVYIETEERSNSKSFEYLPSLNFLSVIIPLQPTNSSSFQAGF